MNDLFRWEVEITGYRPYGILLILGPALLGLLVGLYVWHRKRRNPPTKYAWWEYGGSGLAGGLVVGLVLMFAAKEVQPWWRAPLALSPELADLDQACREAALETGHNFMGWAAILPAELFGTEYRRCWEARSRQGSPARAVMLQLHLGKERGKVMWAMVVYENGETHPHPFIQLPGYEGQAREWVYYRDRDPGSLVPGDRAPAFVSALAARIRSGAAVTYRGSMEAALQAAEDLSRARARRG